MATTTASPYNGAVQAAREALADVAADIVADLAAIHIPTTKDSYGIVLGMIGKLGIEPWQQAALILAMVDAGYPKDTADSLLSILGLDGARKFL